MKKIIGCVLTSATLLYACGGSNDSSHKSASQDEFTEQKVAPSANSLSAEEQKQGWKLLFDGQNTDGWRGYGQEDFPEGWIIEDGWLKALGKGGDIGGDIVYGAEEFGEFELYMEWKIAEGGNSGIFYHIVDEDKHDAPYYTAPEYQVIDQIGFPENLEPWQSIGADYGMYAPDFEGVVKPAGEWNTSRIVFTEEETAYYLNGKKTLSFDPWSEEWEQRKAEGKWKDFPEYGKAKSGFIGLQDHGSETWFRNIKIRKL